MKVLGDVSPAYINNCASILTPFSVSDDQAAIDMFNKEETFRQYVEEQKIIECDNQKLVLNQAEEDADNLSNDVNGAID